MRLLGICGAAVIYCLPVLLGQTEQTFVIRKVTLIDVTEGSAHPNQTVVIRGKRIMEVGATERLKLPPGTVSIDGTAKYIIPGLWDMHVHMRGSRLGGQGSLVAENERLLSLYIANGVTGIREVGGDMVESTLRWRDEVTSGVRTGPRILTSGPKLDGPRPTWPGSIPISTIEEARSAVQTVQQKHADFVKTYNAVPNIPREAYLATTVLETRGRGRWLGQRLRSYRRGTRSPLS